MGRQTGRQTDILLDKEQDSGHADIQTDLPAGWTDAVKAAQGVDTGSRRFARAPLTLVRVCVAELQTGHCTGLDILVTDSNRRRTATGLCTGLDILVTDSNRRRTATGHCRGLDILVTRRWLCPH